jgi:hypothetical protein
VRKKLIKYQILLLYLELKEILTHFLSGAYTKIFMVMLFLIMENWKQFGCL